MRAIERVIRRVAVPIDVPALVAVKATHRAKRPVTQRHFFYERLRRRRTRWIKRERECPIETVRAHAPDRLSVRALVVRGCR